ncbi:hypothetical protein [Pseudomonas sp. CC6-YY-74]|uniref:hypothetical protein n=1 Tax=Pseudomonas sp. CC6-YY-74 TaxID=1930532 RepID=UPI0012AC5693|nr:hypothetical protein [Pseudomonas sp. CC6-YY-74]
MQITANNRWSPSTCSKTLYLQALEPLLRLINDPRAALCLFWPVLQELAIIEGDVFLPSAEASDFYWHKHPRVAQLAVWASEQGPPAPNNRCCAGWCGSSSMTWVSSRCRETPIGAPSASSPFALNSGHRLAADA